MKGCIGTERTVLAAVLGILSCSEQQKAPTPLPSQVAITLVSATPAPSSAPHAGTSAGPPAEPSRVPSGGVDFVAPGVSFSISPDPVVVCDKTGVGEATLSWEAVGKEALEVRIGAPDGALFARSGAKGSEKTERWVRADTIFYLQDIENDAARTAAHTIARLRPKVVSRPCN